MSEEVWYTDPYGVHQYRWVSDGSPASLVRGAGRTSEDPAPDSPNVEEPKLVDAPPTPAHDDLRRSDGDQDRSVDEVDAAWS